MASTGLLNFNVSKLKLAVYDILGVVRHFSPVARLPGCVIKNLLSELTIDQKNVYS